MATLLRKVKDVETKSVPETVHIGGVHFEDLKDGGVWMMENIAVDDVGLILDPHTVMENIMYFSLEGEGLMKSFLNIYKLRIDTLSQGLAISSYEKPAPKVLSTGSLQVIRNDQPYLDKIKRWDDFDHPQTGLKEVFNKALENFSVAHEQ